MPGLTRPWRQRCGKSCWKTWCGISSYDSLIFFVLFSCAIWYYFIMSKYNKILPPCNNSFRVFFFGSFTQLRNRSNKNLPTVNFVGTTAGGNWFGPWKRWPGVSTWFNPWISWFRCFFSLEKNHHWIHFWPFFTVKKPTQLLFAMLWTKDYWWNVHWQHSSSSCIRELREYFKSRRGGAGARLMQVVGSSKFAYCSIYPETSGCCVWRFLSLSLMRYPVFDLSFLWNVATGHCPRSNTRWGQWVLLFSTESANFPTTLPLKCLTNRWFCWEQAGDLLGLPVMSVVCGRSCEMGNLQEEGKLSQEPSMIELQGLHLLYLLHLLKVAVFECNSIQVNELYLLPKITH